MVDKSIYASCDHIQRSKPNTEITEEISGEIGNNYRTVPAFEKTVFDYVYMKHYSLQRNELLKCRWKHYVKNIEERIFSPFQFPDNRDLHFHNSCIRFLPSVSIHRQPDHRMKLKPGPGVDYGGQMPIPQELLLKRGKNEKEDDEKIKIKSKVKATQKMKRVK